MDLASTQPHRVSTRTEDTRVYSDITNQGLLGQKKPGSTRTEETRVYSDRRNQGLLGQKTPGSTRIEDTRVYSDRTNQGLLGQKKPGSTRTEETRVYSDRTNQGLLGQKKRGSTRIEQTRVYLDTTNAILDRTFLKPFQGEQRSSDQKHSSSSTHSAIAFLSHPMETLDYLRGPSTLDGTLKSKN